MTIGWMAATVFSLAMPVVHDGPHGDPAGHSHGPPQSRRQPTNRVRIEVRGDYRFITANGIPDHEPGRFPNRGNPNSIREQSHSFRVLLHPKRAEKITPLVLGPFGVAINGVPFDPGAAEFWDDDPQSGWQYEALSGKIDLGMDSNNAHVQPTGNYHYHGLPKGLIDKRNQGQKMLLIGYAADGFPIYSESGHSDANDPESKLRKMRSSYRLKKGTRPNGPGGKYDGTFVADYEYAKSHGDLDECNGRTGVTPEYPDGIYHYFVTEEFPFIPRYFRGVPDDSFRLHRRGPPRGRPEDGRPWPPPKRFPPPPKKKF